MDAIDIKVVISRMLEDDDEPTVFVTEQDLNRVGMSIHEFKNKLKHTKVELVKPFGTESNNNT